MLAPTATTPISIRLIGTLDRVIVESFADACAGLATVGSRTFVLALRDLVPAGSDAVSRFVATVEELRTAGHTVVFDGVPRWRKVFQSAGAAIGAADGALSLASRRQVIIAGGGDPKRR